MRENGKVTVCQTVIASPEIFEGSNFQVLTTAMAAWTNNFSAAVRSSSVVALER